MEGVALNKFNKLKTSNITMAQCNPHLSDKSNQDASTTATNLHILFQFILTKKYISILDNHVESHGWLQKSL